ncbi:MAG: 50S ribosomal protein L11 [Candidatus Pacebacteria bacterium]|nr:50S ribosomal protein L11 [Candidatus Paceibacterota bacterium]
MAKKVERTLKLQIEAGKATPAPPTGPALGQVGVNIGDFVNRFNDGTKDMMGNIVPVIISVYDDKSFDLEFKTPPASQLIMKKLGIKQGSGKNLTKKVGKITQVQLEEIAEEKLADISAKDKVQGAKIIAGTARSMGVEVIE